MRGMREVHVQKERPGANTNSSCDSRHPIMPHPSSPKPCSPTPCSADRTPPVPPPPPAATLTPCVWVPVAPAAVGRPQAC